MAVKHRESGAYVANTLTDQTVHVAPYNIYNCTRNVCCIGDKYGREVRIIPVDFSDGQVVYPKIAEELKDLDIGILG